MKQRWYAPLALGLWVSLSLSSAQAELIDRGGGLIYDTEADVTWLQDANYARTSGFSPTGLMTWEVAMSWAAEVEYEDVVRGRSWNDWRLPDARDRDGNWPCFGFVCPDSEPGRLHEVYGIRYSAQDPFVHLDRGSYWTSTRRSPLPGNAWIFNFTLGRQDQTGPLEELLVGFAHLVRDGDVGPAPEPAPSLGKAGLVVLVALVSLISWRLRLLVPGAHHLRTRAEPGP
jgi:hypothetical protein